MAAAEAAAVAERQRQAEIAARPRIAFSKMLGQLSYPAQGQILRRFGDSDGLGSQLRGFAVATRADAQVTAPADGRIEFSGPFRSYGQLLIIDAGEGHLILLAGMERITTEMGQVVRAGEPVAQMGKGPSSVTLLGDMMQEKRPVLYVELEKRRRGGRFGALVDWRNERGEQMKFERQAGSLGLVLAGALSASVAWHVFGDAIAASSNADTYKQLNLFGDVFDRVRADYVEDPDETKMIEAAINGMLAVARPAFELHDGRSSSRT